MHDSHYASAIRAWAGVVGLENVTTSAVRLTAAEIATFATGHRIPAIVRPANRAEVQECMRIANQWNVPVYPISGGRNWGYGSRVPASDGCVLLDLGRMTRILDFNEERGYVPWNQGSRKSRLWMELHWRKSALQSDRQRRGGGIRPHTVRRPFRPYLRSASRAAQGDVRETGFERYPGVKASPVHRRGSGRFWIACSRNRTSAW